MLKNLPLVFLLTLFATGPVFATNHQETDARLDALMGANSHQRYHDFLNKLQKSVEERDKETVASMVDYPLTVTVGRKEIDITDSRIFIKNYDKIFTESLVKIILNQKYSDLFFKDTGIMVGPHGELWFSGICTVNDCSKFDIKIMQINN
ncbi:hypothetical protein PMPD1_4379 (plasmid) [Paramixta manurensis]|uniref:Uncharacterized protein n=1 Tax=Paramixta manurensis TaxID=2740817 RepID=A0A6M8ULE1_9GAMM|nr:hypothetical protein PMPD1_4379 [Erwiniaceae bacterium PD-1]